MSIRLSQGTLTSRQHQLPRPEPDGQPIESSQLAQGFGELANPGIGLSRDRKTLLEFDPALGLGTPDDVDGVDG
jgi:hypothetical protein